MDNAHALVVGIANYEKINKLPDTVLNDAQTIYDLLIDSHHCGYSQDNVKLLKDGAATKTALSQALTNLAQQSNQDATVFIYISSHGGQNDSSGLRTFNLDELLIHSCSWLQDYLSNNPHVNNSDRSLCP
ncbi:caspase family protein [Moorena sp. SIO4G3]|uniref:caspase family protein n=1 Tax=Moorena sp. SIO4G3 TaxID=2607821 RepID=UPI001429BC92|nr:caspase family protein [Moorena sp. SIO4G3]NEO80136.1 caspase family protein [Moorena sp. SIO4G3]